MFIIVIASRSLPGLWNPLLEEVPGRQIWRHFCDIGTTFGVHFGSWGSLLEHFGGTFREKIQTGAPKVPTGASPPFRSHLLGYLFGDFLCMFCAFDGKKVSLEHDLLFIAILGRIGHSMRWAHVQSVHACAVQTHFLVFALLLLKRCPKDREVG